MKSTQNFVFSSLMIFALFNAGICTAQPTILFPANQATAVRPVIVQSSQMQVLESLINSSEYEDISAFSRQNRYRNNGRPVGRLKLFTSDGRFASCTAWLISKNRLMTNYHCIDASMHVARASLDMGVLSDSATFDTYQVNPKAIESNESLDYAILDVDEGAAAKYGVFRMAVRDPANDEELYIIHHPMGQPQVLSRYKCRAAPSAVVKEWVHHVCNTQPGSSGSPIISDNDNRLVGLHHAGAPISTGTGNRRNEGIRLSTIVAQSAVLKDLIGATSSSSGAAGQTGGAAGTARPPVAQTPPANNSEQTLVLPKILYKSTQSAGPPDGPMLIDGCDSQQNGIYYGCGERQANFACRINGFMEAVSWQLESTDRTDYSYHVLNKTWIQFGSGRRHLATVTCKK